MKKIYCLINLQITEAGIHALFCRLGIHNWFPEDGFDSFGSIEKICNNCGKCKYKKKFK